VLFMLRWLLFRVMFESGLAKLMSGEPRWRDFTAMDVLYETAPCPTILGYLDHQLPRWWHLGETALTFAAELLAPLLAVFAGRRGRWAAFWLWSALQIGIQLTCNFGWLNTASFALGFLLFDDQMLAAAARRLRLTRLADRLAAAAGTVVPARIAWRHHALAAALWIHFYLSLVAFLDVADLTPAVAGRLAQPFRYVTDGLGCVNTYKLYSRLDPVHAVAEFLGSNDGGRTWRPYEFRYYPQAVDRISPFVAPWFPRFEATLQIQLATRFEPTPLYVSVARQLLARNPETLRLFARDPFPDAPPRLIRVPAYRYTFTNLATLRAEGRYWHRTYLGEFLPLMYVNADGTVAEAVSPYEQVRVKAHFGNADAQGYLGYLFISGEGGVGKNPVEARRWFALAAAQGLADAQFNLALIYANGDGVPADLQLAAHWCRLAAARGLPAAQDRLGVMYTKGEGVTTDETEALAWFQIAAIGGDASGRAHRDYLQARATPTMVRTAEQRAQVLLNEIAAQNKMADR
jgi:TPR repeat protein